VKTRPVLLQPAMVLHTRPFRETSLLIDFLTQDFGRISAIARGAKRPKSSQRRILQPFKSLVISWTGSRDLKTLIGVEEDFLMSRLAGNRLLSGLYLNELLVRLLAAGDPSQEIYQLYKQTIHTLVAGSNLEGQLRIFESQLLTALGYGFGFPEVKVVTKSTGGVSESDPCYILSRDGHFEVLAGSVQDSVKARCFSAKQLEEISRDDYTNKDTLRAAKRLMRLALEPLLAGKPLNSGRMFNRNNIWVS